MAWIKLEHETLDKQEIDQMATILKIDCDAVVGKCLRLWVWADQQSLNGDALSVTQTFIDRITFQPGFAKALLSVGWLDGRDGRYSIPNFDRHNGETAKKRAQTAKRMADRRSGVCSKSDAASVTKSAPRERERERERINTNTKSKYKFNNEDFERFWEAFPSGRKTAKTKVKTVFKKCIRETDPEVIIAAAVEYAASDTGQGKYVKGPETWLNGGCWEDDRRAWNQGSSSPATGSAAQKTLKAAERARERLLDFE